MQTVFRSRSGHLLVIVARAVSMVLVVALLSPSKSQAGVGNAASETTIIISYPVPAVVYSVGDGHIHEIVLKGTWQDTDLTAATGAPTITPFVRPMAYLRSDGVSMVIYTGDTDRHIHAIYLEFLQQGNSWQEVWHWADLTAITGAPAADGQPYGYNRSDGIPAIVYVGTDHHIHDLRLEDGWKWADLTALSGAPSMASTTLGYVRGDGINTVVYQDISGHICELRLENVWKWADLTTLVSAPTAGGMPSVYVRSDGISTINYVGLNNHVYDLRLENGWQLADLTALSDAPPTLWYYPTFGYVRSDGINTVVFGTADDHIYELRLDNGWKYFELTSIPNAKPGLIPVGYVRADGTSAVVYRGDDGHIQEIRLESDGWHSADLTSLAGASPAAGYPWPYNRIVTSGSSIIYLPLITGP